MQKTVIVADDDPDITQALTLRLKQLGLAVMRSPDAAHALVGVLRMRPDLVILDVNMPGGNGLAVAEMLSSDPQFATLPVIIHTGRDDELTRIRCATPHHYYVLKSPNSWEEIKAIVCETLGIGPDGKVTAAPDAAAIAAAPWTPTPAPEPVPSEPTEAGEQTEEPQPQPQLQPQPQSELTEALDAPADFPPAATADARQIARASRVSREPEEECARFEGPRRAKVLCIDDDPDITKVLKIRLAAYNVEVIRAFNGMQGYWTAIGERPDAIICDMNMPDGDGNYIFSRLKDHPLTQNVPVILLTGQVNPGVKRTMLSMGAAAYLTKPLIFDELLHTLRNFLDLPAQPTVRAAAPVAVG